MFFSVVTPKVKLEAKNETANLLCVVVSVWPYLLKRSKCHAHLNMVKITKKKRRLFNDRGFQRGFQYQTLSPHTVIGQAGFEGLKNTLGGVY